GSSPLISPAAPRRRPVGTWRTSWSVERTAAPGSGSSRSPHLLGDLRGHRRALAPARVAGDASQDALHGDVELTAVPVVGGEHEVGAILGDEVVGALLELLADGGIVGVPLRGIEDGEGVAPLVPHHLHPGDVRVSFAQVDHALAWHIALLN